MLSNPDFELTFQEKAESLWILSNLAMDAGVCFRYLTQYNVYGLITTLF